MVRGGCKIRFRPPKYAFVRYTPRPVPFLYVNLRVRLQLCVVIVVVLIVGVHRRAVLWLFLMGRWQNTMGPKFFQRVCIVACGNLVRSCLEINELYEKRTPNQLGNARLSKKKKLSNAR
jgi:hypothetical protein